MALQGTLDTFALPDVLRLLAATKKTGRLRITGARGSGSVWVDRGGVAGLEAPHAPLATEPVDALFELLRFDEGSFTFDADVTPTGPAEPEDVEDLLTGAEALLAEWREIESVVPSMDAWVTLRRTLASPDGVDQRDHWTTLVAVGGGATVRRMAETSPWPSCPCPVPCETSSASASSTSAERGVGPSPPHAGACPEAGRPPVPSRIGRGGGPGQTTTASRRRDSATRRVARSCEPEPAGRRADPPMPSPSEPRPPGPVADGRRPADCPADPAPLARPGQGYGPRARTPRSRRCASCPVELPGQGAGSYDPARGRRSRRRRPRGSTVAADVRLRRRRFPGWPTAAPTRRPRRRSWPASCAMLSPRAAEAVRAAARRQPRTRSSEAALDEVDGGGAADQPRAAPQVPVLRES